MNALGFEALKVGEVERSVYIALGLKPLKRGHGALISLERHLSAVF